LLVLLVDEFLFEGGPFVRLLLQPLLLRNYQLLLAHLKILLVLGRLDLGEVFAQGVRLSVLALLHEPLEDLLVLQELGAWLEAEAAVEVAF
jgi:hypothetical protein